MRFTILVLSLVLIPGCSSNPANMGGGAGADASADPVEVTGCEGQALLASPDDTAARGPWAVGARTVQVGRLTTEIWYPAEPGSAAGAQAVRYDLREALPPSQQEIIPDAKNTWQDCDCYRDLPVDTAHGPYPVVVFVHGTASFRTQSLHHATHWASRGFVVVAADHPGLTLADSLALVCPDSASGNRDLSGDVDAMMTALASTQGPLAFLAGHLDLDRVAVTGHSAGGNAIAGFTSQPGVRVAIPMAASGAVEASSTLEQILFIGGMSDAVVDYGATVSAYEGSPAPRRLVGVANAGHLVVSDLCAIHNDEGKNMLEVAQEHDICGAGFAGGLFDCDPSYTAPEVAWEIVDATTAAVLEATLQCTDRSAVWTGLEARFDALGDLRQDL